MLPAFLGQRVGSLFDIHVRCLRFLGVHHVYLTLPLDAAGPPFHLVGVEHHDDAAFFPSLVVAQAVDELRPGAVQVLPGDGAQRLPGVDDVIAVHQKVVLPGPGLGLLPGLRLRGRGFGRGPERVGSDRAIGLAEDGLQLFVQRRPGLVAHGRTAHGGPFLLGLALGPPAAVEVHMGAHLVPGHVHARPV